MNFKKYNRKKGKTHNALVLERNFCHMLQHEGCEGWARRETLSLAQALATWLLLVVGGGGGLGRGRETQWERWEEATLRIS